MRDDLPAVREVALQRRAGPEGRVGEPAHAHDGVLRALRGRVDGHVVPERPRRRGDGRRVPRQERQGVADALPARRVERQEGHPGRHRERTDHRRGLRRAERAARGGLPVESHPGMRRERQPHRRSDDRRVERHRRERRVQADLEPDGVGLHARRRRARVPREGRRDAAQRGGEGPDRHEAGGEGEQRQGVGDAVSVDAVGGGVEARGQEEAPAQGRRGQAGARALGQRGDACHERRGERRARLDEHAAGPPRGRHVDARTHDFRLDPPVGGVPARAEGGDAAERVRRAHGDDADRVGGRVEGLSRGAPVAHRDDDEGSARGGALGGDAGDGDVAGELLEGVGEAVVEAEVTEARRDDVDAEGFGRLDGGDPIVLLRARLGGRVLGPREDVLRIGGGADHGAGLVGGQERPDGRAVRFARGVRNGRADVVALGDDLRAGQERLRGVEAGVEHRDADPGPAVAEALHGRNVELLHRPGATAVRGIGRGRGRWGGRPHELAGDHARRRRERRDRRAGAAREGALGRSEVAPHELDAPNAPRGRKGGERAAGHPGRHGVHELAEVSDLTAGARDQRGEAAEIGRGLADDPDEDGGVGARPDAREAGRGHARHLTLGRAGAHGGQEQGQQAAHLTRLGFRCPGAPTRHWRRRAPAS